MTPLAPRIVVGCAFVLATGTIADGLEYKRSPAVPPVCASRSDPALARTRAAALAAARVRSFPKLRDVLAPTVSYLLAEYTPDGFVATAMAWPREQQDDFWAAVVDVLELPLVVHQAVPEVDPPTASAYHRHMNYPEDEWVLITGRGVEVRSQPSSASPVVARLSQELVPSWYDQTIDDAPRSGRLRPAFLAVLYDGARRGWVDARFARSRLDFAVVFQRIAGAWKVADFAMGD